MPAAKAVNQVVEDNAIVIMSVGANTDPGAGIRSAQDAAKHLNDTYFANGFRVVNTHVAKVRTEPTDGVGTANNYAIDLVYVLVKDVA